MSNKIYDMLIEVMKDMQEIGLFDGNIEQYMDFDTLTKNEVEWYLKSYIVGVYNMGAYTESHGLENEFEDYRKSIGIS